MRKQPKSGQPDGTIDTDHADYRQILNDYSSEGWRPGQVPAAGRPQQRSERSAKRYGSSVKTTGSAPRDVRADVDISTNDRNTATRIAREWKERGDKIRYDKKNGVWINRSQDISLWHPPTEKQLENRKITTTHSPRRVVNRRPMSRHEAIRDPEGTCSTTKKFIHSVEDIEAAISNQQRPKAATRPRHGAEDRRQERQQERATGGPPLRRHPPGGQAAQLWRQVPKPVSHRLVQRPSSSRPMSASGSRRPTRRYKNTKACGTSAVTEEP